MPPRNSESDDLLGHLRPNAPVSVIKAAKASLKEPSRPYTPADSGRQLFSNSDYGQNRPSSSYGVPTSKLFYDSSPKLPLPKLDPFSPRQELPNRTNSPYGGLSGTSTSYEVDSPSRLLRTSSRPTAAETVAALKANMGAMELAKKRLPMQAADATQIAFFEDEDDGPGEILDPRRNDDLPPRPNTSRGRPSSISGNSPLSNEDVSMTGGSNERLPVPQRMGGNAQVLDIGADGSDSDSADDEAYRHLYSYAIPRDPGELAQEAPPAATLPRQQSGTVAVASVSPPADSLDPGNPIAPWRAAVEDTLVQLAASTSAFATASGPAQRDAMSDVMRHTTALGAHVEYVRKQPHSTKWLNAPCTRYRDVASGQPLTLREAISEHVFRLMDSTNSELLLKGCGIVLRVVKSRQPLLQASKLLYRLSKDTANDSLFRKERLLEPLLRTVGVMVASTASSTSSSSGPTSMHEPLVFLNGCLKNVSNDAVNQRSLVKLGALQVLASLLTQMATQVDSSTTSSVQQNGTSGVESVSSSSSTSDMAAQVAVQVTGVLRNLAVSPTHASVFVSAGVLPALRLTARALSQQQEVVLNVGRILSKLSLHEDCQAAMEADSDYAPLLVRLLGRYAENRAILLRLAFVMGNLTTNSNSYREQIAMVPGSLGTVVSILEQYALCGDAQASSSSPPPSAAAAGASQQDTDGSTDRLSRSAKHEECIIKMLRLVANLAIHPEAGMQLAENQKVTASLLALLSTYTLEQAEELVLNCTCALTNLSFYQGPSNRLLMADPASLLCHITPLLMCDNGEAQIEAARAYGNFSRMPESREYMQTARVLEALLLLMDHSSYELLYSVCGTLINFSVDDVGKEALLEMGAVQRLMEVMERVVTSADGLDIEVDILLVVFKALFNMCASDAAPGEPLSDHPAVTEDEITTMEAIVEHIQCSNEFASCEEVVQLSGRFVAQLRLISHKLESLDLEPL